MHALNNGNGNVVLRPTGEAWYGMGPCTCLESRWWLHFLLVSQYLMPRVGLLSESDMQWMHACVFVCVVFAQSWSQSRYNVGPMIEGGGRRNKGWRRMEGEGSNSYSLGWIEDTRPALRT